LAPGGPRLGGAAAFAGLLARGFGHPVTILTAIDDAFPYLGDLAGISLRRAPSGERTRFRNHYRPDGSREQTILSRAAEIPGAAIRDAVRDLPPGSAVLYCPVADELEGRGPLPRPRGRGALAGAVPQGLFRRWDPAGRVAARWSAEVPARLAGLDFASVSETEFPEQMSRSVPLLAVTRGRLGAVLHRPRRPPLTIPASPCAEVDPTGAGDVFAAALLAGLWRALPLEHAAGLAAAAAAISVESFGTAGVPTLAEAQVRFSG
jgi:hypothetical protein